MRYDRVYNFSAGPAMMPESVLEEIAAEVLNYHGSGMSVMEMSHRSPVFQEAAVKKKQTALTMEYASFLYKLMALLRAGLTIRGAFERLAQSRQVREHYIDEEIRRCCNEMKSGVPEAQAYENFGRRCQLPEYIKMGTILAQNLRKGSDGLADLLEAEALRGMEERHQLARKLGEQAGTKLLFPMMLMFGVVLIILMAPALMSFSF